MVIPLVSVALLAAQQSWTDVALAHEWEERFDHALIARAAALRENDTEQGRRELARAALEYEHLRCVLRIPVPQEAPVQVDNTGSSIWAFPRFGDGRGARLDVEAGRMVAAWKDLRLFSEDTGALLAPPIPLDDLTSQHGGIGVLELDPTGRRVAVVFTDGSDHALYVFELATGGRLLCSTDPTEPPVWSPSGATLAFSEWSEAENGEVASLRSFGEESDLAGLDAVTGGPVGPPRLSTGQEDLRLPALSPDGQLLAAVQDTAAADRIFVWETRSGRRLGPAQGAGPPSLMTGAPLTSLHITAKGRVVACQENGVLRIFETKDLVAMDVGLAPGSHSIVTDDSGEAAVLVSTFSRIAVLGGQGEVLATCRVPGAIQHVDISEDGKAMAWTGSAQGAWGWRSGTSNWESSQTPPPYLITPARFPDGAALDPSGDGAGLLARPGTPGAAEDDWHVLRSLPGGSARLMTDELGIALQWRSGDRVVPMIEDLLPNTPVSRVEAWHLAPGRILAGHGGGVDILDPTRFEPVARIDPFGGQGQYRMAGDRVALWRGREVRLYDAISGEELLARRSDGDLVMALPVPGRSRVVTVEAQSSAAGVSLDSFQRTTPELVVASPGLHCAGSRSGLFSLVDDSGAIRMLDSKTGRNWVLRSSDGREVTATRLSPDGSRMAVLVAPHSLLLFETLTGEVLYRDGADRWDADRNPEQQVRFGDSQFDPSGRTFLFAPWVPKFGTSQRPTYGRETLSLVDASTGSLLSEYRLEGAAGSQLELLAGGERILLTGQNEVQLLDAASGGVVQEYPGTRAWRVQLRETGDERVLVLSDWKAGLGGQLAALDPESGAKTPIASDFAGRAVSFGRDPLGRYLCLSHGERWMDLQTGELVADAPALAENPIAGSTVSFGPDGLVLVNGCQLGRIHRGTFERIGRRRWTAGDDRWNERASDVYTGGASFLGDRRVLVHAYARGDELVPVVLDFGPATCPPLEGTPDHILESWCQRLALELSPKGEIVPRLDP